MQDLLMSQIVPSQNSVTPKKTPQSEFQSRDDAAKKDFMDAVRDAISSEKTDSAPKKTEQPKEEVQEVKPEEKPVEKPVENQAPTESDGKETLVITVDPSYSAVFPNTIPEENTVVVAETATTQELMQNALTANQVQVAATQAATGTPQQQGTVQQSTVVQQAPVNTAGEQSTLTGQTTQNASSQTVTAQTTQTMQSAQSAETSTQSMQTTNADAQGSNKTALANQKGAETATDGSLLKAQQSNPDTIYVKVGENGMPKNAGQLTAQLGEKIQANLANGRQQFDIQLEPQELGKIHIKMTFEAGRVTILIQCSNPETQQLLAANAGQLREVVENNTSLRAEVLTEEKEDEQAQAEKEKENQAKEEQKDRQKEQLYHSTEIEMSSFLQKFRLGIADFQ